ncbi:MAG: type II CRISPR-associated endonuclease Cas1 [Clostridia bacterium]|nr:type II CRISPR-associated endonuclease Cas1 [Clostridia bacterium]
MGWRSVVVDTPSKISFKNNYLVVTGSDNNMIHISEIDMLMISTTQATITAYALSELNKAKVRTVFCDEKRNPYGEISAYYGSHNTSKKINLQLKWDEDCKMRIFTQIIRQKIANQAALLTKIGKQNESVMLSSYLDEIQISDITNREGFAAKVYFNALFGKEFSRQIFSDTNAALDYGYTILLSAINRAVINCGCLTQLGLKHCNEYNFFNLSCDIIEPFRVIVDEYVYENIGRVLDRDYKFELVNLLNNQVRFNNENISLVMAIKQITKDIINHLNCHVYEGIKLYEL